MAGASEIQQINISLFQGVDTKTDETLVQSGFTLLENAEFGFPEGALSKRNAYEGMPTGSLFQTGTENPINNIASFNNTIYAIRDNKSQVYSKENRTWFDQGKIGSVGVQVATTEIIHNDFEQSYGDMCLYPPVSQPRIRVAAWNDSRGGIRYTIYSTDGAILNNDQVVASQGNKPRVFTLRDTGSVDRIWILYERSNGVFGRWLNANGNLTDLSSEFTFLTSSAISASLFDAFPSSDNNINLFYHRLPNTVDLRQWSAAGVFSNFISVDTVTGCAYVRARQVSTLTGTYYCAVYNSGSNSKTSFINTDYSSKLAPKIILSGAATLANATLAARPNSGMIDYFFELQADKTNYSRTSILKNACSPEGQSEYSGSDFPYWIKGCGLAGDAIGINNQMYVPLIHESAAPAGGASTESIYSTWFLAMDSGTIQGSTISTPIMVAKAFSDSAGDVAREGRISNTYFTTDPNGKAEITSLAGKKGILRVNASGSGFYFNNGYNEVRVKLREPSQHVQVGNSLYFDGGFLAVHDGTRMVENNFHIPCSDLVGQLLTGFGISGSSGSYQYLTTYESIDSQGNLSQVRGLPMTLSSSLTGAHIVQVRPLHLSNRPSGSITTNIWRTQANGTIFRKLTGSTGIFNDGSTMTFNGNALDDASIAGNEILNTEEVRNYGAPPCHAIALHMNRLFLAASDEDNVIWYSKEFRSGETVWFSQNQKIKISSDGGRITALHSNGSVLVIFKSDRIFLLTGEGPDRTGANANSRDYYPAEQLVTSDVGCINKHSLIQTPKGLIFQSRRGLMLMDSGLNVTFIGENVESFTSGTITSAQLIPEKNSVRWGLTGSSAKPMIVYDYEYGYWNTFTDKVSMAATRFSPATGTTSHLILNQYGSKIYMQNQNSGSYLDKHESEVGYSLKFETGWIALNKINGYQRVRSLFFNGETRSPCRLLITVYRDQNRSDFETHTVDINSFTSNGKFMFETPLEYQKCESIKVRVEDISSGNSNPPSGSGYLLSTMSVEVKGLRGFNKNANVGV